MPLHGDTDLNQLRLHYDAGVRYLSVNVGMDMNPLPQILTTIAGYRRQIAASDWIELAESAADIPRIASENRLALSFDLEGALPLLETPDMVALYHRLGVRQIHLAYNRSNSVAGGAHDEGGLTPLGETIVDAIHAAGILMDLSHSNEQTALDICAYCGDRPVLFSHANPRARVAHGRNITDRAIRACAAPGGKTGHILEMADCALTALDIDPVRLQRVQDNLTRLGLHAQLHCAAAQNLDDWWDGQPFDAILADVPCTASGTIKRNPDIKWLRRSNDAAKTARQQEILLDRLWQTLKPGGRMLLATCSLFHEENGRQCQKFLQRHADAQLQQEQTLLPNDKQDGFYYALISKSQSA